MASSRRLLHRWFVEYKPLYLLSAMLVLGGTIAIARGLGEEGSRFGAIAVAGIVEVYALALIGGAALLYRVGHRRSAVMLAFLAALYQGDLMLHTETFPNLGGIGELAVGGWLALFVAKLVALARGMRLRMNHAALATFVLGATGLAAIPWILHAGDARMREAAVLLWLFAVLTCNRYAVVSSAVELDPWGAVVLRRSVRGLEVVWGILLFLHVGFWMTQSSLAVAPLLALVPLVLLARAAQPGRVAVLVLGTLGFVLLRLPAHFSVTVAIAAMALALRARSERDAVAMGRLAVVVVAAACAWLAVWTVTWKGAPFRITRSRWISCFQGVRSRSPSGSASRSRSLS